MHPSGHRAALAGWFMVMRHVEAIIRILINLPRTLIYFLCQTCCSWVSHLLPSKSHLLTSTLRIVALTMTGLSQSSKAFLDTTALRSGTLSEFSWGPAESTCLNTSSSSPMCSFCSAILGFVFLIVRSSRPSPSLTLSCLEKALERDVL